MKKTKFYFERPNGKKITLQRLIDTAMDGFPLNDSTVALGSSILVARQDFQKEIIGMISRHLERCLLIKNTE